MPPTLFMKRVAAARALVHHTGLTRTVRAPLLNTVTSLGAVQMDPMRVVAPAHLLTLRLRRGPTSEHQLSACLRKGLVIEAELKERCLIATQARAAAVPGFLREQRRKRLQERGLQAAARTVLAEIEKRGALTSREIASEGRAASFWSDDPREAKATMMALDILASQGILFIVGRRRGERVYDLAERLLPSWRSDLSDKNADLEAALHYGRTMGLFRLGDPYMAWQRLSAAERRVLADAMTQNGAWRRVELEGASQPYLCDAAFARLAADAPAPRAVRLLAPLDNLLWDRRRLLDVFAFAYTWEAYTPAAKRRVGPYGMPVLQGTRLTGQLSARFNTEEGLQTTFFPVGARATITPGLAAAMQSLERDLFLMAAGSKTGVPAVTKAP